MAQDILYAPARQPQSNRFAKLSLLFALLAVAVVTILGLGIPRKVADLADLTTPFFLILALYVAGAAGVVMSILSIYTREHNSWIKWSEIVLNLLLTLFIISAVLFARYVDAQAGR